MQSQADVIIDKFGGARRLSAILCAIGRPRNPATIFKWRYPREKGGTGGLVPTSAVPDVLAAARYDGVMITAEDLFRGLD